MKTLASGVAAVVLASITLPAQSRQASLGRCELELGGVIQNCRVGYRTFGVLDASRRNAILIPTWFASGAEAWLPLLGPSGVVDTTGFFVVVVESLGAASSSSPTNSVSQKGSAFPELTIGDMVDASYRVARDHLGLPELYAVVGISLGGLQAFEWGVRHPGYARRLVPIVGTPRQGPYGRAMWELLSRVLDEGVRGAVPLDTTATQLARFMILAGTSPTGANAPKRTSYAEDLATQARQLRDVSLPEWASHSRAILRHDIARTFGGDMTQAARVWKGTTLIVVATQDHSVDAEPALQFARLIGADTLVIPTAAGHSAIFSDRAAQAAIRQFLRK